MTNNKEKKVPYYKRDHVHCFDVLEPACGIKGPHHHRCCICLEKVPSQPSSVPVEDKLCCVLREDGKGVCGISNCAKHEKYTSPSTPEVSWESSRKIWHSVHFTAGVADVQIKHKDDTWLFSLTDGNCTGNFDMSHLFESEIERERKRVNDILDGMKYKAYEDDRKEIKELFEFTNNRLDDAKHLINNTQ